ncbi:hypothetical protein [Dickeya phage Sucellus]|nr:hypothetical protein [Dickeya phage Sucellus]
MKRRQVTCNCSVYKFPHRFGGGKCNGMDIVLKSAGYNSNCNSCYLMNNGRCEVILGQESPKECQFVIDFIYLNEVKLK